MIVTMIEGEKDSDSQSFHLLWNMTSKGMTTSSLIWQWEIDNGAEGLILHLKTVVEFGDVLYWIWGHIWC